MIYFPSCKINLGLQVLEKRADGFHEIESGMLEVPFTDALEMIPSEDFSFSSSGLAIPGTGNLCTDAFQLLQREHSIGNVALYLRKNIPMGGGLGGGSSDAAYTLRLANALFSLDLSERQLEEYAAGLGSDCPFFIRGGLQLATGRGEKLAELKTSLPKLFVVLVNIGIHVPTATAYSHITPRKNRKRVSEILLQPIESWKEELVNDFEESVFTEHPVLGDIKKDLYNAGATYAAMSGSGSTLFGLFGHNPGAIAFSREPVFLKGMWIKD